MENLTSFNFSSAINSVNKPHALIKDKDSLSKISITEISGMVDRINFFIRHFDILTRKNTLYKSEVKITFLKKLRTVLLSEIDNRKVSI
ncbi:MAG: hypothetical protein WC197_04830 [Candidatus Gastranaerophilaceae bacterium]|jgi:YbbR domain-containing protein